MTPRGPAGESGSGLESYPDDRLGVNWKIGRQIGEFVGVEFPAVSGNDLSYAAMCETRPARRARRDGRGRPTPLAAELLVALDRLGVTEAAEGAAGPLPVLVVGVSGGADSMALLDALWRWREVDRERVTLVVAHLNHQLRGEESDQDEAHVVAAAAAYGLPCVVERQAVAELARAARRNLEATARECRYQFLERVAVEFSATGPRFVCTAHTADDQAETVLMRLLRGSGTGGLAGIAPQRMLGESVRLIRPLLGVTRQEVLAHCLHHHVSYRNDSSNDTTDLLRNRIRHELLEILRTYNPEITATLGRTADLLREEDHFLQALSHERLVEATVSEPGEVEPAGRLRLDSVGSLPRALRRRVIRDWLALARGGVKRITMAHLAAVESLIDQGQSGQRIGLPGGGAVVRVFGMLAFEAAPVAAPPPAPRPYRLTAGEVVRVGDFQLLLHPSPVLPHGWPAGFVPVWTVPLGDLAANETLFVRTRQPGDRFRPAPGCHRIKLKTLMIRHKIPRSKRHTWPVIVTEDDRLIWVPALPVSGDFAASHGAAPCAWLLAGQIAK